MRKYTRTLREALDDNNASLTPTAKWDIAFEIAGALAYLHGSNPRVHHKDIKAPNIMLDDNNHAIIVDFGLSSVKPLGAASVVGGYVVGTYAWMAPEIIDGKKYTSEADIFSFGVVSD